MSNGYPIWKTARTRNRGQVGLGRMFKYEVIIYWSSDDESLVAEVPELPGCNARRSTQELALANAQQAIALWIETAKEFGDPIPEPKGQGLRFA